MSIYKFLDAQERLTKKNFMSYQEARAFARENDLVCLVMDYTAFCKAFETKVHKLKGHYNYEKLETQAKKAMDSNVGAMSHVAIKANDFMHRIIELPTPYIVDWLEGKNNLEWPSAYWSEEECSHLVTYERKVIKETPATQKLHDYLGGGLEGVHVFQKDAQSQELYGNALRYWSNSMGELHHYGQYDITEQELPEPLQHIYQEFTIFEQFGSRCYLCETEKGYGIALVNEYDEGYASDCKLSMDSLFLCAAVEAAALRIMPEFQGTEVFLGECCGMDGCHELCVVFPATVAPEIFYAAAEQLDKSVYQVASELMKIEPLLKLDVTDLPFRKTTLNALSHTHITTLKELTRCTAAELKKLQGCGEATVEDVNCVIEDLTEERSVPNLWLWSHVIQAYEGMRKNERLLSLPEQIQAAENKNICLSRTVHLQAEERETLI